MSKKLKRVPLDFRWKTGETWSGFVNPHSFHECLECEGSGYSKEYYQMQDKWYSGDNPQWKPNPFRAGARYDSAAWNHNLEQEDVDALVDADRLWDFTRVPINSKQLEIVRKKIANRENSWLPFDNGYKPTAQEVNEWSLKGFGHDSINCSVVIAARLAKQGISHLCSNCNGEGVKWQSDVAKDLYENWKKYEPPVGEGFQLWTDNAPLSPVFKTLEDLCQWCESNATTFGSDRATKEEWAKMLSDGFVYHQEGNSIFIS